MGNKLLQVLVLCTGNSCRSQMMEGFLKEMASDRLEVKSAGIEKHGVNPNAIQAMAEVGIDISTHTSDLIDKYMGGHFDFLITVCDNAKENCPYFATDAKRLHQNFSDPSKASGTKEEVMIEFRKVRDSIKIYCKSFIKEYFK